MGTKLEELLEPVDIDVSTEGFTLILFNDNHHDFEEVINQIIKATGFSHEKSESITLEAHNKGKAPVIHGTLGKCLEVQHVLEEISLRTSIEVNA